MQSVKNARKENDTELALTHTELILVLVRDIMQNEKHLPYKPQIRGLIGIVQFNLKSGDWESVISNAKAIIDILQHAAKHHDEDKKEKTIGEILNPSRHFDQRQEHHPLEENIAATLKTIQEHLDETKSALKKNENRMAKAHMQVVVALAQGILQNQDSLPHESLLLGLIHVAQRELTRGALGDFFHIIDEYIYILKHGDQYPDRKQLIYLYGVVSGIINDISVQHIRTVQ